MELHPTASAPVVFAQYLVPGAPTVLFYNHYDVQPADPLELWHSDPLTLTERDGQLFGRGVRDVKGQLVSRIIALDGLRQRNGGELPFGVKFVIEGEEEVGSPNIEPYLQQYTERLQADTCVWEFGGVDANERPVLTCGLKDIVSVDLGVLKASHDQHSGRGPVVQNAAWLMAAALASMRDIDGRVLIDGFYDLIRPVRAAKEAVIASSPLEDAAIGRQIGVTRFLAGATREDFQRPGHENGTSCRGLSQTRLLIGARSGSG